MWIMKLGLDIKGAHITQAGEVVALPTAGELLTEMSKGLLLCDLVSLLEGVFVGTLNPRPKVLQEAMHNINKALAVRPGNNCSQQ